MQCVSVDSKVTAMLLVPIFHSCANSRVITEQCVLTLYVMCVYPRSETNGETRSGFVLDATNLMMEVP